MVENPEVFLSKLAAYGAPADGSDLRIGGLAKPSDDNFSAIQLSSGLACVTWIPIPADMIQSIEQLAMLRCKDHEHPLVRLTLRSAAPGRKDVAALLGVIAGLQEQLAFLRQATKSRGDAAFVHHDNCMIVDASSGLVMCCTVTDDQGNLEVECGGFV